MKINSGTLGLVIIVVLFLTGITTIFNLQYDKSDNLPRYSSLRADPLGTKIFYESLSNLSNLNVQRNFRSYYQLPKDYKYTFFFLGPTVDFFKNINKNDFEKLHGLIQKGNRLVFTLTPDKKSDSARIAQKAFSQRGEEGKKEEEEEVKEEGIKKVKIF